MARSARHSPLDMAAAHARIRRDLGLDAAAHEEAKWLHIAFEIDAVNATAESQQQTAATVRR